MARPQTLRKALILVSMGCGIVMEGYIFGHTSTMVAGLYEEKEQLQFTDDDISWITSLIFSSMVFGTIMATFVTEKFGRRLTIAMFQVPIIIHWIVLYYVRDLYVLLFIRFLVGFCFGGAVPIIFIATAEYSSPKMRGIYLTFITSLGPSIGGTAGHLIGLAIHWRTAALAAVIPVVIAALLPVFCVESPQWLASRGRFEECEVAFRSLHGTKPSAEKELQLLIELEKNKLSTSETKMETMKILLQRLKVATTKKYFWDVTQLTTVIQIYKTMSGKILTGVLGVTILQYVTGSSDVLLYSIAIDIVMIAGCVASTWLSSKINVRTLLFCGGILNNVVLIALCILLYMKAVHNMLFPWVNTILFAVQGFVVNASLFPVLEMLPSELYPLEIKSACLSLIGVFISIFMFAYIKVIPGMFESIGYYGVYMVHVVLMCVCMLYLWIKLPETKGRTLQEIEMYFKNKQFISIDELLKGDVISPTLIVNCEARP